MKKILIIVGGLEFGGVERFAVNIIRYAPPGAFRFDYLIFDGLGTALAPEVEAAGGRVISFPSPSRGYGAYARRLGKLLDEKRYDVVHSHTQFNSGLNLWVAKRHGVPVRIAHSHTTAHEHRVSLARRTYEALMRRLIMHSATSRCACGEQAGRWMYGKAPFTLIRNGIDTQTLAFSPEKRARIRAQYALDGDAFLIGHCGTLCELKNQEFLIRLLPGILREQPNARLMLVGRGDEGFVARLHAISEECGVAERVLFAGAVRNVDEYLCAFDAFAFPSYREGTPLALLEAQANGLPCIVSDAVPPDALITSLIAQIPLDEGEWTRCLCAAKREDSGKYARLVDEAGYGVRTALTPLYEMYGD